MLTLIAFAIISMNISNFASFVSFAKYDCRFQVTETVRLLRMDQQGLLWAARRARPRWRAQGGWGRPPWRRSCRSRTRCRPGPRALPAARPRSRRRSAPPAAPANTRPTPQV